MDYWSFSSDLSSSACLSAAASCWWCSDKNNYPLCAAQLPCYSSGERVHTHSIKRLHSAAKMKQAATTQCLLCVSVCLWSCPFVPVFMRDTCSTFTRGTQNFSTYLPLENQHQPQRQAWVFPSMWTAEYLMGSSVFSASSRCRSSFVRRRVYRTKPQQASHRSCQGNCHSWGILQHCQTSGGLSCLF